MATKLMMIDFHLPITYQSIQEKLTNRYIKRDGNGMTYTIGGHQAVNQMQQKLMG